MDLPTFFDKQGEMCNKDNYTAYGDIVDLAFSCPDLIFVANEYGLNTNTSGDKMSSDNKRVTKKGYNVKIPLCSSNVHFTTLGITALTGVAVCAVIIIAKSSPLTYEKIYGFDPDVEWVGDDDIFNQLKDGVTMNDLVLDTDVLWRNTSAEKAFPGGLIFF